MGRTMRRLLLLPLLLAACASPAPRATAPAGPPSMPPADAAALREALMEADRGFAASVAEGGLEAWMAHFAPDAVRLTGMGREATRGLDAIREADAGLLGDPSLRLTWAPVDAGAYADGRHGFTTGRYQVLRRGEDGAERVVASGAYVTVWRLGDDGRWRVILDTGAPDPPGA